MKIKILLNLNIFFMQLYVHLLFTYISTFIETYIKKILSIQIY